MLPSIHHDSRWCILNCSLRLGWSGEVKLCESEGQRDVLTGVDHMSRQTCLGQETDFGGYELLCRTRALVGQLSAIC